MREVTIYRTPLLTLDPNATAGGGLVEVVTKADHDAALRRAKAEVWREAEKEARLEISRGMFTGDYQLACRYLAESYSARAAQIEEGE